MSLIKNELPILEYDTNNKAIIMPGHSTDFRFPERAVMLFTADSLANVELHDTRNWGNDTFVLSMNLAMDAVTEV